MLGHTASNAPQNCVHAQPDTVGYSAPELRASPTTRSATAVTASTLGCQKNFLNPLYKAHSFSIPRQVTVGVRCYNFFGYIVLYMPLKVKLRCIEKEKALVLEERPNAEKTKKRFVLCCFPLSVILDERERERDGSLSG